MIDITSAQDFEQQVLNSPTPVVVDFWAPWCNPCKALAPTFAQVAEENRDTRFVKVNIDEVDVAAIYGVRGIPTLMTFKNGNKVASVSGAQQKARIQMLVDELK